MFIDTSKRLLYSDNPHVIEWMVKDALKAGEDLCADPFVFGGQFCQWVTVRESLYEYKLISAYSPSEFEQTVKQYELDGYELAFREVDWNGMLCQWMVKLKLPRGLEIESAVVIERSSGRIAAPVFQMVENVQFLGRLSFGGAHG